MEDENIPHDSKPSVEKPQNKNNLLLTLLVVLFFIASGISIYAVYQNNRLKKQITELKKWPSETKQNLTKNEEVTKLTTADGQTEFIIQKGTFSRNAEIETIAGAGYIAPENYFNAGSTAKIRTIDNSSVTLLKPIKITMKIHNSSKHIDENTISIFWGDPNIETNPSFTEKLESRVNPENKTITANTNRLGVFGVLGKLKCPNDTREPRNDRYKIHGGQDISFNEVTTSFFDSKEDVDYYFFNLTKGKNYTFEITNKTEGVIPIIELSND
jgi:hypothetical protein